MGTDRAASPGGGSRFNIFCSRDDLFMAILKQSSKSKHLLCRASNEGKLCHCTYKHLDNVNRLMVMKKGRRTSYGYHLAFSLALR